MMAFQFLSDDWITPFGIIFIAGIAVLWFCSRRIATVLGIDASHLDLLVPLAVFTGVVGGVGLTFLTPTDKHVAGEALQTWLRMRFFGMALSGALAVFIYSRVAGLSFRSLLDCLALPTIGALFIHRFGCLLAGCCWGDIAVHTEALAAIADTRVGVQLQTLPWLAGDWVWTSVQFAPGTYPFEQQLALGLVDSTAVHSLPVHPVQIYEALGLLLMLVFFWRSPVNRYPRGMLAMVIVGLYAFLRFFIGYLRADSNIVAANLTMTQIQCVALFIVASLALLVLSKSQDRASRTVILK
ncbi:MAG: prolipoprotein diacylglyceryl transferase [Gammaproteobacteria bacterium]|nr:prolipoprotein diacylglyceryl transferase [Gammaproteobacteria bacterium]